MVDPRSEPSMEDILASIKRIIADDQAFPLDRPMSLPAPADRLDLPRPPAWPPHAPAAFDRPPPWPTRPEAPEPPESILELTNLAPEEMQPPRVPPASRIAAEPPRAEAPPSSPPELPVQRAADRAHQADIGWRAPEEAIQPPPAPSPSRPVARDLGQTIVNRAAGGENTIEGLVREMLRPMLSDWIDTHAPAMVERIVQEEIRRMMERESGGR